MEHTVHGRCVQTLDFRPGGTNSIIYIIDLKDAPAPLIKELPSFDKKMLTLLRNYYPGIIYRHISGFEIMGGSIVLYFIFSSRT